MDNENEQRMSFRHRDQDEGDARIQQYSLPLDDDYHDGNQLQDRRAAQEEQDMEQDEATNPGSKQMNFEDLQK